MPRGERVKNLGVMLLTSAFVFSSYTSIFFASSRANRTIQSVSLRFDSALQSFYELRASRLTGVDARFPRAYTDDEITDAVERFFDLSRYLRFEQAWGPSEQLRRKWYSWLALMESGVARAGPETDLLELELISLLRRSAWILSGIGQRIRMAFDISFLLMGLLLSLGTAGAAAFYSSLRQSMLKERLAKEAFRLSLKAEEDVRKAVALELHDNLAQDIAAARMMCERARLAGDGELAGRAACTLKDVNERMRGLCSELRPSELRDMGLGSALKTLCRDLARKRGYAIEFCGDESLPRLPEIVELNVYRILREACVNACKYADRGGAELRCRCGADRERGRFLEFELTDEGFQIQDEEDLAREAGGFGLGMNVMRERASAIDALLDIDLRPEGSSVRLRIDHVEDRE